MKSKYLLTTVAVTSLLVSGRFAAAQDPSLTSDKNEHTTVTQAQAGHPKKASEQELKNKVTKVNKASSLIGMSVKNLQNESLGEVEDLAINLDDAKIPYAVLSVGGFLGLNEKYIAVPLTALTPAPGEGHLVLDANKDRLQQAAGFAKNQWPDLNSAAWGPQSGFATATGTSGKAGEQRGTASERSDTQHFSGRVTAVDASSRSLTVNAAGVDKIFTVDRLANVSLQNQPNAKLDDIKVGSQVSVEYLDKNGTPHAKAVRSVNESSRDNR